MDTPADKYRRALLKKLRHAQELQAKPQLDAAQQAKLATLPALLAELEARGWTAPPPPAAAALPPPPTPAPTKPSPRNDRPSQLERSLGATTSVAELSQALGRHTMSAHAGPRDICSASYPLECTLYRVVGPHFAS